MSKQIFCAECGSELLLIHKALPKQQMTIMVIAPHTCPEETKEFPFKDINNELILKPKDKTSLSSAFDKFKFVKQIDEKQKSSNPKLDDPSDKRPSEDKLDLTEAPAGIKDAVKKGIGHQS